MYITHTIITTPEAPASEPTVVLNVRGVLDGSNYQKLVETARANHQKGARRLIINMAAVPSVSAAGVAGLFIIGEILEGRTVYDQEGWAVLKGMSAAVEQGRSFRRLALVALNGQVASALHAARFDQLARMAPSVADAISAWA